MIAWAVLGSPTNSHTPRKSQPCLVDNENHARGEPHNKNKIASVRADLGQTSNHSSTPACILPMPGSHSDGRGCQPSYKQNQKHRSTCRSAHGHRAGRHPRILHQRQQSWPPLWSIRISQLERLCTPRKLLSFLKDRQARRWDKFHGKHLLSPHSSTTDAT